MGWSRRMVLAALLLGPLAGRAFASDSASLQFTIPAPDPVQAGETLSIQALGVNTGAEAWAAGSYYWVAEVYDLEYAFLARTKPVNPTEEVASGGVAAIALPFPVPDTMIGRKLYRVSLVKDNRTLIQSDFKPFQVVEKVLPPPPPPPDVEYRVEGNVTGSYKNTSRERWKDHRGATTINVVGKLKESSFLFNGHLIHEPGQVVDPFILLLTYYAPWGRVYAGDISPNLSVLSVSGQGMRGLMLEQQKGRFEWVVLGGQTLTSQAGTATANGRYARTLYGARGTMEFPHEVKASLNGFLSSDESGSLSTDPKSSNFRGPNLKPQKNQGVGLGLSWQALEGFTVLADYQSTEFQLDTSTKGVKDTAWRGELRWEKKLFKTRAWVQRAGPNFRSFGAPSIVGDRMTYDLALSLFPAKWYTLSAGANQYKDNLANDPIKLTITQTTLNLGNVLQFQTGTGVNLGGTLSTSKGKPSTALDNQTTTLGLGLSQALGRHSVSFSGQTVQFRDKNKLAHDLDTLTVGLTANLGLPGDWRSTLGANTSDTKDKVEGSKRSSQSGAFSVSFPIVTRWTGQVFGTYTKSKNTSPTFPASTTVLSANSEFTWSPDPKMTVAFGPGYNDTKDTVNTGKSFKELTASLRVSRSF